MTVILISRQIALTALFALMLLRFVDLAVFDKEHDPVITQHFTVHASEMIHDHAVDDLIEHDMMDGKAAHVGFHTLLNVFIGVDAMEAPVMEHFTVGFGFHANDQARTQGHRPPTPPPLF